MRRICHTNNYYYKKEHIEEYNKHIRDIINNLEDNTDIFSICSYLMNICKERFLELTQDEYLKIKKCIDNNIDVIDHALAPMNNYFDLYKICYHHYYCSCYNYVVEHIEFHEKIIKIYFNIEYIKFFYLLQKEVKLNKSICNINVLIDIFINLYDNSNINCNKKINYMIYIIILFLINSIMVINKKRLGLLLIHIRSWVIRF